MKKLMITMLAVAGVIFALAPAAWADGTSVSSREAPVPPPGGYPEKYRLMFLTDAATTATSTDISYYNTFVNDVANNLNGRTGSIVAGLRATWRCIGSTETVGARANSKTLIASDAGYDADWDVPIYNFAGELLSPDNASMWDGALLDSDTPNWDTDGIWDGLSTETGDEQWTASDGYGVCWTGTDTAGNPYNGGTVRWLGYTAVRSARTGRLWSGDWIGHGSGNTDPTILKRLYGLSEPLPVPPAGTVIMVK